MEKQLLFSQSGFRQPWCSYDSLANHWNYKEGVYFLEEAEDG